MWPIVVCNPTFLDRILAYGCLIAMSQCLIFRVRLKEAQTMNKEHHASAPLYLAATAIRNQHPRAANWSSALHNKDREESSVMAAQTKCWMSTKKSLYLRIPFQFDNPLHACALSIKGPHLVLLVQSMHFLVLLFQCPIIESFRFQKPLFIPILQEREISVQIPFYITGS